MDTPLPPARRRALAERLERHADRIAADVTAEFLDRHPDWVERYGDVARVRGIEDARFHVQFLAGALLAGRDAAFEEYAVWTAGVLKSRHIEPAFLVENLVQVGEHAARVLEEGEDADEDAAEVARLVAAGTAAIRRWEEAGAVPPDRGPPTSGR